MVISARLVASEQPMLIAGYLVACQALRYPQGASSFESPSGSGQQAHPHGHSSVVMRRSQLTKKEKQPAMDGAWNEALQTTVAGPHAHVEELHHVW